MKPVESDDVNEIIEILSSDNSDALKQYAFEKLYLFYWKPLKNYAERRTDNATVEDLLQDVFFDLWIRKDLLIPEKIRNKKDLEKWLMDRIKSKASNIHKSKIKHVDIDNKEFQHEISSKTMLNAEQVDFFEQKEYEEKLQQVINALPPDLRLIYMLKIKQGYSQKQIAYYMRMTETHVKERFKEVKAIVEEKMLLTYQVKKFLSEFKAGRKE